MKTFLLWVALFGACSYANDGFFQGAGQTLLPINEPNLFVHTEELDITPVEKESCYEVLYQGKKVETLKSPLPENVSWHRQERGYGKFSRSFTLPAPVDAEQVAAELKNGVLLVKLPKREEVKPRRVQVKVD